MIKKILEKKISKKLENGIFIINKESGRTSHDEVHFLRKSLTNFLGHKIKVGHSGTLDPKVTGVLVLGSGKATKILEYILLSEKQYIAEFLFHKKVSEKNLEKSLEKFRGKINQLPPVKSAVKRRLRQREVYELKILSFSENSRSAKLLCSVERGTYIRKLAHDLGIEMGVNTSMGDLIRIQAGVFSETNSNIISEKEISMMIKNFKNEKSIFKKWKKYKEINLFVYPISEIFNRLEKTGKMKKIFVKQDSVKYILSGAKPRIKNIDKKYTVILQNYSIKNFSKGEIVSIFYKSKVLAVGEFLEDFSPKNYSIKNNNKEYQEKEIIKLKKVF